MPEGAYYTCRVLWSNTEIELAIVPANKDGKLDRLDVGPGYTFDATTGRKRVFVSLGERPGKNAFLGSEALRKVSWPRSRQSYVF